MFTFSAKPFIPGRLVPRDRIRRMRSWWSRRSPSPSRSRRRSSPRPAAATAASAPAAA